MRDTCTEEMFLRDVAEHKATVIRDDGVHRHIQFRKPGTYCMGFDLITWPGHLCYTGDMGTYVFQRLEDMFQFFRCDAKPEGPLRINLGYWGEKVLAVDRHSPLTEFSEEKARQRVAERLDECEASPELRAEVAEALEFSWENEYELRNAASAFGKSPFNDFWETDLHQDTFRFVWCCYALAWGIRQYDSVTARQPVTCPQ